MYSVALVLKNVALLAKLTALHIWGEHTGFEIQSICNSFESISDQLKLRDFDLVIIESNLVEANNYQPLEKLSKYKSCSHIALCSEGENFEAARNGIVLGVDDYFTVPFKINDILNLFKRIESENKDGEECEDELVDELYDLFNRHDPLISDKINTLYRLNVFSKVLDKTVAKVFDNNDWLDLYLNENEYLSVSVNNVEVQSNMFLSLFKYYEKLLPNYNESLGQIISYILYNPESDLRLKSLSENLHINKSYLSTVFIAQTGIRFVDYITNIKLMRGAWLLKNTDMKVSEIALRLDYKDTAYFSKKFRQMFNITPSEYRLPDDYIFEI